MSGLDHRSEFIYEKNLSFSKAGVSQFNTSQQQSTTATRSLSPHWHRAENQKGKSDGKIHGLR